jgi:hypothetical protein
MLSNSQLQASLERLKTEKSPYFGFYCIFINKSFEICRGGLMFALPFSPVCIYESAEESIGFKGAPKMMDKLASALRNSKFWRTKYPGLT